MSSSGVNLEKYLIPLDEINRTTDNFSRERCIGGGGFGSVYKGQLSARWRNLTVAVKRLDADSHQGEREFRNEVEMISRFDHENIITFIGYCDEGGEMIIIYEYALNGSLDHHLQDPNKMNCITWAQRLEICIGAAKGLDYLHSGLGEKHRIIHRDVKSANILLDGNMVAKICDFGLSKLGTRNQPDTRLYTKVAGTHFYLDPSYLESGILQKESDIYSLGVVLFEIVSGMLVYRQRSIGDERQSLIHTVRRYYRNEPEKVIDPCIRDQIKSRSFDTFKDIAYQCISFKLTKRPTLFNVIMKLEDALVIQLSGHPASTPADRSLIESIIGKLSSVSSDDQQMASSEIALFAKWSNENRIAFGKAGVIAGLTQLLRAPDSRTQEHALTALHNLSYVKDNSVIIYFSGAVPEIIHLLEKGSTVARETAADIICALSLIDGAKDTLGSAGAIPPLVLLMSEGGMGGKLKAASSLCNLCMSEDNRGRAVTAGLVPNLIDLLTEPQGSVKERTVDLLAKLSNYPEVKLAIGEAEVVPHLVEVMATGYRTCDQAAVTLLDQLFSMDEKYLVEAQELGVMEKLKNIRQYQHATDEGKRKARELRRKIKNHQHVDHGSNTEMSDYSASTSAGGSTIETLITKLNSNNLNEQQNAIGEICLLTKDSNENRADFAKAGAIPRLTHLLTAPDSRTQHYTMMALSNLSYHKDNRAIIISTGAVPGIVHILEKGSNEARENAAAAIYNLCEIDEAEITIGSAGAIPPLVLLLSKGTMTGKKNAAYALASLCLNYENKGRAVRAGLVPILMELLREPQGVLKEESVGVLARILRHPESMLAIGEAKAVPHLVEVVGTGSPDCQKHAILVLMELCAMDQKYLVEAQELGVMGKLKDVRQHGTYWGRRVARMLRRTIKHHQHVDYGSDAEIDDK